MSNNGSISQNFNFEYDNKRQELIEKCKHMRSLFETEFELCNDDDDAGSSSYLDMNGVNRNYCIVTSDTRIKTSIYKIIINFVLFLMIVLL